MLAFDRVLLVMGLSFPKTVYRAVAEMSFKCCRIPPGVPGPEIGGLSKDFPEKVVSKPKLNNKTLAEVNCWWRCECGTWLPGRTLQVKEL